MKKKFGSEDFQVIWDNITEDDCAARRDEAEKSFSVFSSRLASHKSRSGFIILLSSMLLLSVSLLSLEIFGRKDTEQALTDVTWSSRDVPSGSTQIVDLPDGSRVTLNGGSQIVYPSSFGKIERGVFFSGEAYFEVAPDAEHPFIVNTSSVSVRVKGTEFNLKSYRDDGLVDLALFKGAVDFQFTNNNGDKVTHSVHPGEHISFDVNAKSMSSDYSSIDQYASWKEGKYFFKDETLANIAKQLERIYDVRFIITDDCLKSLTYHMAIDSNKNIGDAVSLLNMDPRITATINGSDIYIASKH